MIWSRWDLLVLLVCPLSSIHMSVCPLGCCCPGSGLLVLCESLGLRSLPVSVPLTTRALSVAGNRLCDVDHLLGPISGLQQLSLNQNLLTRVPRGLPPSLESLLLRRNRIAYITGGALRNLGNLTHLDLEENRIRAVQPGALRGLGKLRVLILGGNRLTRIPPDLPASLTHLDLSDNCISVLDPSLSTLVQLQVLKVSRNRLRSIPEGAFDPLPRLRLVDLDQNRWACGCDILYLYGWLLLKTRAASDLVCSEPVHLARRPLLDLPVTAVCPRVTGQNQRASRSSLDQKDSSEPQEDLSQFPELFSLETPSSRTCWSWTKPPAVSPSGSRTSTSNPAEELRCRDGADPSPPSIVTSAPPSFQTNRDIPAPSPGPAESGPVLVVSLLAGLCVLVAVLTLAVLLVLKKVVRHQQRVVPLDAGSAG